MTFIDDLNAIKTYPDIHAAMKRLIEGGKDPVVVARQGALLARLRDRNPEAVPDMTPKPESSPFSTEDQEHLDTWEATVGQGNKTYFPSSTGERVENDGVYPPWEARDRQAAREKAERAKTEEATPVQTAPIAARNEKAHGVAETRRPFAPKGTAPKPNLHPMGTCPTHPGERLALQKDAAGLPYAACPQCVREHRW